MIPEWKNIEGLSKWLIRKAYPDTDYKEYLGLAYEMYDKCKKTFDPTKGNFASYFRLRLYGELHRSKYRHGSIIYGVMNSNIDSLNIMAEHGIDGWETEALDLVEDTRCFVDTYDDLAAEIVDKLDQLQGIDLIKLATIKRHILYEQKLKTNLNDPTYDAAIELISTYLS